MKLTVVLLAAIWLTIALSKLHALLFVAIVLAVGLAIREYTRRTAPPCRRRRPLRRPRPPLPTAGPPPPCRRFSASPSWSPPAAGPRRCNLRSKKAGSAARSCWCSTSAKWPSTLTWAATGRTTPTPERSSPASKPRRAGLKVNKLYSISDSPADTIIDIAATFGVDTVVLGGSRRATLVNLLKGNVVARVAANLPESMHLIVIG